MTKQTIDDEVVDKEKEPVQQRVTFTDPPDRVRRGRSVFGPVVLIAAGIVFLLANLNILPEPNWGAALRFWPLLLVFLGLNILAMQARAPLGTLLSLLISIIAVGFFSFMLFAGSSNETVRALAPVMSTDAPVQESFSVPAEGVERAEVTVDMSNFATDVTALEDDDLLVEGVIWTSNGLALDSDIDAGVADISIGEESTGAWFLNPLNWGFDNFDRTWQIGLNPSVPTELRLEASNGTGTFLIDQLTLTDLYLDVGNGSVRAVLPSGDYPITIDGGNGSARLTLPSEGTQELELDGGNGSITLGLSDSMEARVEFDEGNGVVAVDERFELVSGDRERGVYETAGYDDATNRILMIIETGNGSVRVTTP